MNYKQKLRNFIDRLPYVRTLKNKVSFYESNLIVPPGHFYSPIVNTDEIISNENKIFNSRKILHGIDLNLDSQYKILHNFKAYYQELFFTESPTANNRYFYDNTYYSYSDVIFLFSIMLHYKPKRIVEIGSGYSSAAILDINEKLFNNSIEISFIEPYPENLKQLVKHHDKFTLLEKKVQDIDLDLIKSLQENDILFIDSTHVAKTNSDVLFEIFQILPLLNKGVKIHFHDIFYPFEYPRKWVVNDKKNWNEIYFLQSFLMYNDSFKIIAWNTCLEYYYPDWFKENMPMCLKNTGGSIWIEKV